MAQLNNQAKLPFFQSIDYPSEEVFDCNYEIKCTRDQEHTGLPTKDETLEKIVQNLFCF